MLFLETYLLVLKWWRKKYLYSFTDTA